MAQHDCWTIDRHPEQHGDEKSDWIAWVKNSGVYVLVQIGHQAGEEGAKRIIREFVAAPKLLEALKDARSFVELVYGDESGEEAADAKYVLDRIDAAIAKAGAAILEEEPRG